MTSPFGGKWYNITEDEFEAVKKVVQYFMPEEQENFEELEGDGVEPDETHILHSLEILEHFVDENTDESEDENAEEDDAEED